MKNIKILLLLFGAIQVLGATPAIAGGDAVRGKKVFNKCKACHSIKVGKHKIGPSLAGVIGRKAGTAKGFKRYKGLRGADWAWDEATLDEYLTNPKLFVKSRNKRKSSMILKLKKKRDRDNVIAYLKTLK
ncbi:MAG: c-type cytochrome [Nitrospinales bacterium]|jgi:cytochrome c|nr:c-type cytochrome [Nitrospinales bacterium]MCS5651313.1 c-type cytochrome [Candidatus Neomarinimicrobiota bacterium]|tara:strand:- start:66 stop:455 length:390 start_codon:yes stop_codon:yes gene_type:complete